MANVVIGGAGDAAGIAPPRAGRRGSRAIPAPAVLAPGEADAHLPDVAHWDLPVRAALVFGLAVLSWAVVGAGVFLLLHR